MDVGFVKSLFYIYYDDHMVVIFFYFVNVMNYIDLLYDLYSFKFVKVCCMAQKAVFLANVPRELEKNVYPAVVG